MDFFVRTKINNIFRSIKLTKEDFEQNKCKLVEIIIGKGKLYWKNSQKVEEKYEFISKDNCDF